MLFHGTEVVFDPKYLRPQLLVSESSRDGAMAALTVMAMSGVAHCAAKLSSSDIETSAYRLEGWPGMELPAHKVVTLEAFTKENPGAELYRRQGF